MSDTERIPLFPLGVVLLPDTPLPLHIFEERYKLMIYKCIKEDKAFGIVLFDGQSLHTVGCTARVTEVIKRYEDGRMDIMTQGEARFIIQKVIDENEYMEAYVNFFEDDDEMSPDELQPTLDTARELIRQLSEQDQTTETLYLAGISDPLKLSFAIPGLDEFSLNERQKFLEMTSIGERIKKGIESLSRIVERRRLTIEINSIIGGNGNPPKQLMEMLSDKTGE